MVVVVVVAVVRDDGTSLWQTRRMGIGMVVVVGQGGGETRDINPVAAADA